METSTKLKEIREVIIKAVPEIVELKFGCEIVRNADKAICKIYEINDETGFIIYIHPNLSSPAALTTGEYEIIGRPIRLSDVLLAIGSTGKLKINNLGGFSLFENGEWNDIALPRWNLSKDLNEQSAETISFIHSLLVMDKT